MRCRVNATVLHNGKLYNKGEEIILREGDSPFLFENNLVSIIEEKKETKKENKQ